MIRKLILSALIAIGAAAGLTVTPGSASADPPGFQGRQNHRERYEVLVRHGRHWDMVRTLDDRRSAERLVRRLEARGYDARVRCVEFDRR